MIFLYPRRCRGLLAETPNGVYLDGRPGSPGGGAGLLFPIAKFVTSAVGRCRLPLAKSITPAPRASIPLSIYGEGVADRPGVRSNERSRIER